jgi:predicted glycoside hydrolase/deacetylase ChbG (UPF0249 family)
MPTYLIINADDFGYTRGVNRGILEAHQRGVVLSTSLMVEAQFAAEAGILARTLPSLGVGLHFVVTNENGPLCDLDDLTVVAGELERQYRLFCDLLGQPPTHLDSHHHVHRRPSLSALFREWAEEHQLPLRGMGPVHYNGGFYGQWYDAAWHPHPAPEWISIENLERLLRRLPQGVTEMACHPAYVTPDLDSTYAIEREMELATLLNPRVPKLIRELGITLTNFAALPTIYGRA